jgi:ubiquinone/menaquinone biosynthesis C-methylase UbiE
MMFGGSKQAARRKTKEKIMSQQQSPNPAEVYEHYFVANIFAPWTPVLLNHAAPRRGERVLDVACGTGIVARQVAPMVGETGTVVALDLSPAMLAVARTLPSPGGAAIEWREGNALALSLPDHTFDLVLCQQGLQFFVDRSAALREMRRVLVPGGRVALSVWQALQHHPLYEALYEATARHLGTPVSAVALSFSLGDAEELRTLLDEAGFERIALRPESLTVRLSAPERFTSLTVMAAAAVVPSFAQLDIAARTAVVEAVKAEIDATLQNYVEGDTVTIPLAAHIAMGYA